MSNLVTEFNDYREKMNDKILADNNKIIKRIFNLDTNAFQEGALDANAPQTTSATLIDLIKNTNSVINSQLDAFKAAFPTRGEDITANLVGSTSGNRKRYTKKELEKLRRNKFVAKQEDD